MTIVLSTDGLRPNEREAFWRHVMSDTFAPASIREMAEGDVAGSIRGHWVGRLTELHPGDCVVHETTGRSSGCSPVQAGLRRYGRR